jgi:hypothetical protein
MAPSLKPEDVTFYNEQGYLVIAQSIFSAEKFARLQALAHEKYAEATEKQGGTTPSLIDCPHWSDPRLFEWLFAEEVLDLVEPLIGPDIAIFACHFLQKPPQVGKRVPWHEDSAYWKGRLEPIIVASITIALEPSTTENGCLEVLPGTHRHGYSDYLPVTNPKEQIFPIEVRPDQYDASQAVSIELQPNQANFHDARIIHGSAPNSGTLGRSAFTIRYFPTTVRFIPENNPSFQVYLARGEDRAGNPYSDPTKTYPPAGFIA